MKDMIPIIKKEFKRYFTDKRLLLALILPGILIYVMYSLMGNLMTGLFEVDENYEYQIHVINQNDMMEDFLLELDETFKCNFTTITEEELDSSKELVKNKEIELIVIYDDNFNDLLQNNQSTAYGSVELYYNYDNTESVMAYTLFNSVLSLLKDDISTPPFGVNQDLDKVYDLVDSESTSSIFAMIIPMLLMMFLVTGVLAVATESVAGEKERGTISSLLITPVSRVKLAFAKIISIAVPGLLSAMISFIGVVASLPQMMEGSGMTIGKLSFIEYFSLFMTIVFAVLFFTVLMTLISTYAKSIKESQQLSSPVMVIVTMCGIMIMFIPNNIFMYLIPTLNTALLISSIFGGTFEITQLLLMVGSNLVFIIGGVFLIAKMFNTESIMFNK